jgi:hypothetical protein
LELGIAVFNEQHEGPSVGSFDEVEITFGNIPVFDRDNLFRA